jgi:hypothetical protein
VGLFSVPVLHEFGKVGLQVAQLCNCGLGVTGSSASSRIKFGRRLAAGSGAVLPAHSLETSLQVTISGRFGRFSAISGVVSRV